MVVPTRFEYPLARYPMSGSFGRYVFIITYRSSPRTCRLLLSCYRLVYPSHEVLSLVLLKTMYPITLSISSHACQNAYCGNIMFSFPWDSCQA